MAKSAPLPNPIYPENMCAQKSRRRGAQPCAFKVFASAPLRQGLPPPTPGINISGLAAAARTEKESESAADEQAVESFTPSPRLLRPQHRNGPMRQHTVPHHHQQQQEHQPRGRVLSTTSVPAVQSSTALPSYAQVLQHRSTLYRWATNRRTRWRDQSQLCYLREKMRANDKEDPIFPELLDVQDANSAMSKVDRCLIVDHTIDPQEQLEFAEIYSLCYSKDVNDPTISALQAKRRRWESRRSREEAGAVCWKPTEAQRERLRNIPWLPTDEGYDQAVADCPVGAYAMRIRAWRDAMATLEHMKFCGYGGTSCKHANLKAYWNEKVGRWDICEGDEA